MREIFSYLVRIVRRDGDVLDGVVEQVRSGRTAPFATLAELTDLLSGRRPFGRRAMRRSSNPLPADAGTEPQPTSRGNP